MKNLQIHAALLALPLLLAATGESLAWTKTFGGTRDQVRTACAKVGGDLYEGSGTTTCLNNNNGTGVTCDDGGVCTGGGSGPGPARMGSTMGLRSQPLPSWNPAESGDDGDGDHGDSDGGDNGNVEAPAAQNGGTEASDAGIGSSGWSADTGGSPQQVN